MKDTIGIGVIGMNPTNMGSTMTLVEAEPDLRFRIRAMCAQRADVLARYAKSIGVGFWTTDFRELVARDDIEVVCVYSPDHLHFEHCAAALEAGKHVVCTKPMVTDLEHARRLVALARERGRKFLVGQTMRFDRQFNVLRRLYEDGDLGDLIAVDSYYVHDLRPVFAMTPWRLEAPQDFMFGGCVHSIDVVRSFAGDIEEVHAVGRKGGLEPRYPLMDNFFINLKFKNGVIGRVMGLYGVVHPPMPMMQVSLYGTRGTAQADFTDNEPGQVRVTLDRCGVAKPFVMDLEPERDASAYGHGATVIRYMRHFQDCLDNDRTPAPDVLEGAKGVAAGVAAWESIRTARVVASVNEF